MSAWVIDPFRSFGPLRFSAMRREVQDALDEAPVEFTKGASEGVVEACNRVGLHAYYDDEGRLELIEAFSPCSAFYARVDLQQLGALGLNARDDQEGGLWLDDHGFALYAPNGVTEGVSIFRQGYATA